VPAVWLMLLLLLLLPDQNLAWSLPHSASVEQVSSNSTLTGDELLRIGEIHDHQFHFRETLTYYELALSTFREKKQTRGIATALVKIARVYERQGRIHEAHTAVQEAVSLLTKSSDRLSYAQALSVMGRISARLGHQEEARASLTQATSLFNRLNDRRGWNEASIQLGLLQVSDNFPEQGLSLLQQAREDAHAREDHSQHLAALMALGTAHWLLDHPHEARRFYEAGLRLAEMERNMPVEAALQLRLAYFEGEDGQVSEGIESAKHAIFLSQTLHDTEIEAASTSLLADLYRKMGLMTEAEESEQRALSMYRHRQIHVHGVR
jgi:tetratricopeptide (TPR) repeat protein